MLGNLSLTVGKPWWLIAIPLILPPLIWMSARNLAGLGGVRRALAILLRSAVVALIVLALAELQTVRKNDRLTTIFLLDVSQSIPTDRQTDMLKYVNAAVKEQKRNGDMAGVIVFGKDAKVESPPAKEPQPLGGIDNKIDAEYSDLEGAIKLALGSFPEDTARRLVILSDGNENRGNALEEALAAKGLKVQVDVLPIDYRYDKEVLVEKVSMPPDVKQGETININVVVRASAPTTGRLQVYQKIQNFKSDISGGGEPQKVTLKRGINVFTVKQRITEPNFFTFTAEFTPDEDAAISRREDRAMNNRADGFVHARGTARVLLIEGTRGEHAEFVQALREKQIEVDTLVAPRIGQEGAEGGDQLPTDLAQLQPYDSIILGNVPKDSFTDAQIQLLESNCHDMGGGLVMLGGPNSFGAGAWRNTPVEKALPVDMEIKAMKIMGKSALVMVMHASEIPEGNYWQKVVAQEAIKTLSPYDYAGMLHWEGSEAWLFQLQQISEKKGTMLRAIDRMTPGDMPDFDPSLVMGINALRAKTDAMTKHFIVISDGDPTPPTPRVINQLIANKITVTSVLVAAHGGDFGGVSAMQILAQKTKGRFYNVQNPKALPRIYQKEARLISRPLIYEQATPWAPATASTASELIAGFDKGLPPISGLVLTSLKEDVLVECPLVSPQPKGQTNPLLAHWQYGLGRAVAFTSDTGRKWTKTWPSWESYAAFWTQVIRWSLRPVEKGNLTLSVRREEGRIKIVVDALDKDNQFLNFLQFQGVVLRPDLKPESVTLVQKAPGRYEGVLENAEARGNYFVNLAYRNKEGGTGLLSAGVSVPYSDEYRELKSNPAKLVELADSTGGKELKWKTRRDGSLDMDRTLQTGDVFRRDPNLEPPKSFTDLWPNLLFFACCLFLGDVAVRRVAPDFARMRTQMGRAWQKLRGREVAPPTDYMEKLKGRKAEVVDQIERTRSATRFEAPPILIPPNVPVDEPLLTGEPAISEAVRQAGPKAPRPGMAPEKKPAAPASYTDRLMKAKQKVWEEREKDKDKGKP